MLVTTTLRRVALLAAAVLLGGTLPSLAGTFDVAYYGARWQCSRAEAKKSLRGTLTEEKPTLSPWDLPHVRELGHLYYIEEREFARLTTSQPGRLGGANLSEYYFFRDKLAMVRVRLNETGVSFQGLLESLTAEYGPPRKETSESPEEVFVQHRYELPRLIIQVSYHPRRIPGGYTCEDLQLFLIHRDYIDQVQAYHESLKARYGKQ